MSTSEFDFLNRLSSHIPVHYFLLSPCAVFWSDIRSDREKTYLENHWRKRLGEDSSQVLKLEELLRDRNPLLANFGRIGREMALQIESSDVRTHACYVLSEKIQELNPELSLEEDFLFIKNTTPLSLLHSLQADLLLMRNPQNTNPHHFEVEDRSLQLHIAPCKRREVEILYHNLLMLISENPSLCPGEIIVMAPQIEEYASYIQGIFGMEHHQLDYQILDLGIERQSEIVQGFLLLLELSQGRWDASELLELFGHSSFQRCHHLTLNDYQNIQEWIEEVGIRWGDDLFHRNELLERRHCQQGMADETMVGTWDYGLSSLILGLISYQDSLDSTIEFSDRELLGKWVNLMHALRDDLAPLHDRSRMTINDWVNYLSCLLANYFKPDDESRQSRQEYEELNGLFEGLRKSSPAIQKAQFEFSSIKTRLLSLIENLSMPCREDHIQAVRFCSMMPLRSIPAKCVALLGMEESAFPRIAIPSSLNRMKENDQCDYCPTTIDFDRYLFLEALHSAQDYFLLSYSEFSQQDNNEVNRSLVVEELFNYLDQHYTIQGKKIKDQCLFRHPIDSFDVQYFVSDSRLNNFSQSDFQIAQTVFKEALTSPHRFVDQWSCVEKMIPSKTVLNLKNLVSAAKDPIRFHFNQTLELYLENIEDRQIKTDEEIVLDGLVHYQLKQEFLKDPLESIIENARKKGKLPMGMFQEVTKLRLNKEIIEFKEQLDKHSLKPTDLFEIEFTKNCSVPEQTDEKLWQFPPVVLTYDENYQLSIVGKLSMVSTKGLVVSSKDKLPDIWKIWPQFLLYSTVVKHFPQFFEHQLIFLQAAKAKKSFFDDPEPHLKKFIRYYALCLENFSPLMPDWVPLFLDEDSDGLQDKIIKAMSESSRIYQSPYLHSIFSQEQLPDTQKMIKGWKSEAKALMEDVLHYWMKNTPQVEMVET